MLSMHLFRDQLALCPPRPPRFEGKHAQGARDQPVPDFLPALELRVPLLTNAFDPLGPRQSGPETDAALVELRNLQRCGVAFSRGEVHRNSDLGRAGCEVVDSRLTGLRKTFRVGSQRLVAAVRQADNSRR